MALEDDLENLKVSCSLVSNINYQDKTWQTGLMTGTLKGQVDNVCYLLECGADLNIGNSDEYSASDIIENDNKVCEQIQA